VTVSNWFKFEHSPTRCDACGTEKVYCRECEQPTSKCPRCDAAWMEKHERLEKGAR
jgi:predicted Zn-ribbon and HTH transcriptional regulator